MNRPSTSQGNTHTTTLSGQHSHSVSLGRNGEMAVPSPAYYEGGRGRGGPPSFELARSPPSNASNKNTKHVPCKFFRQGACQAGNACPFLHSSDPMMHQAPCKYFMKGNCRFGHKCALAHYLPSGERVSKAHLNASLARSNSANVSLSMQEQSGFQPAEVYADTASYSQQAYYTDLFQEQPDPFPMSDDDGEAPYNNRYNQHSTRSNHGSAFNSPPTSQFGSPPNENGFQRPTTENLRSALDATLPASFDANSLPHIAKYGPFGQSVPDKFGMRSPSGSVLSRKLGSPPDIGLAGKMSNIGSTLKKVSSPLSMSPQLNPQDAPGPKFMHSQRVSKPRVISASVPRTNLDDWSDGVSQDASDFLPSSLHDDVMLPEEKSRRHSRQDHDLGSSPDAGLNIPRRASAAVGSPPMGSSPSRFRAIFEEEQRKKDAVSHQPQNFGHVGSPLRESWMPSQTSESPRAVSMSGISQAMARMDIARSDSSSTTTVLNSTRPITGLRSSSNFGTKFGVLSSPGLNGKRIDEEVEGAFFEMDDENNKRHSNSAWQLPPPNGAARKHEEKAGAIDIEHPTRPVFGSFRP